MDKTQEYIANSLEQHLFFARIMKEHSLFLSVGFLPPNADFAKEGECFLKQFEAILSRAISLGDCMVRCSVLESGELVTDFTDCAECQTEKLTGVSINRELTACVKSLKGRSQTKEMCASNTLTRKVRQLNRDALALVEKLIGFKERILCAVNACNMFTVNYPLLIEHILREARLYRAHLMRLEGMSRSGCREIRDSELFWNQIMMEHAMFIRGLLDPSEAALIDTADDFADDYKRLLETSASANDKMMSLALTQKFRDFKQAGTQGIEGCKIRSIILPLLADHVLREANHYIRLLKE